MSRFSQEQIRRYSRQILLREVGGHGQSRLGAARPVLLCPDEVGQITAEYLWRAGITELGLLVPTAAHAARLTAHLVATGYPGPAAQTVTQAAEPLQRLVQRLVTAAPGFTGVWLPAQDPDSQGAADASSPAGLLLWACGQATWGAVGQGAAALLRLAAEHSAAAIAGSASGSGAMILGSALALLTMQRILGTAPTGEVWQIDLASPTLPTWR